MNRAPSLTLVAACTAIGVAIALASCADGRSVVESESGLLKSVEELAAKQDHKTALIHLRNGIQRYPDSAAIRLSMGRVLLAAGEAASAAVELEKAWALKAPEDEVLPLLARAILTSGEAARVTSRFEQTRLGTAGSQAELLSVVAAAHWQSGQQVQGDAALNRALEADPTAPGPLLLQARRQAARGEIEAALGSLTAARVRHPDKAQLSQFEGELLLSKRDLKGAEAAFSAAVQARTDHAAAHAGLVGLALQQRDTDLARQRAQRMAEVLPRHPQTLLVQGRMALLDGQQDLAQEKAQQLLRMAPDDPRALLLAGEVALRHGALQQGEVHLNRVLHQAPETLVARKLLAQAHLKGGSPAAALAVLQPALDSGRVDGATHALAAQAHLKEGHAGKAVAHFKKAKELNPDDTRIRAAYALAQFGRGQSGALSELESLAERDEGTMADLALISARLQQHDHDGALKAVRALEKKQPRQPLAAHLEGRVLMMQGQHRAARTSMERALEIDPQHLGSLLTLVQLDVQEGHPEAGTARLESWVQKHPRHHQAVMALAEHRTRLGAAHSEIDELLQRAVQAAPESAAARLALVGHRLSSGQNDTALKAAQEAVSAVPQRSDLQQMLARAQYAAGDRQQAAATLRKLVSQDPRNTALMLQSADLQVQMDEPDQARQTLRRLLDLQPELLDAQRRLISLEMRAQQSDRALEIARQIQQQRPREAIGLMLEGEIAAHTQSWQTALKAYRSAHKLAPSTDSAVRLHTALLKADQSKQAQAFASEWERAHPKDAGFQIHLGEWAAGQGQWASAERHFARAAKLSPDNGLAHNNLAYAMAMQSKRGAVEPAQRAMKLLPGQVAVMDTMALALAADRQLDKALALQRKALEQGAAQQPTLRLTMARLYLQAGDKTAARQELQTLASLGARFPAQREVSELLKSI